MKANRIPLATYRLQFSRNFTFAQAADLVPYLSSLGISHVYASPYLMARPGSTHGYDIIDHSRLNPEVGTDTDYEHFVDELHKHGMGQVLDIVPNHMGVMGSDNIWWIDVLENGESSSYADFFDIDWQPLKEELDRKILVPVLGDQYGKVLDAGELKLIYDKGRGEFSIFFFQHRFPVDPSEYPRILSRGLSDLEQVLGAQHDQLLEFQSLIAAFIHLPGRSEMAPEKRAERARDKEIHKRRLQTLGASSGAVAESIEMSIREINGTPGYPASFNDLHDLIKAQAYRLAYWRVAADDINYRRFFDINDLAGLCTEKNEVFDVTHRLVLDLIRQGKVDGLRIDHPDGLYDPAQYLARLQGASDEQSRGKKRGTNSIYVVVEKILIGDEQLPVDWPVDGTTGYDFLNLVNRLFVDPASLDRMTRTYRAFIKRPINFENQLYRSKKIVMHAALASELNVLANALSRIALSDRHTCDFTVNGLREAISKIVACFPVYRTYISGNQMSATDRACIERAVACAKDQSPGADATVFDFTRRVLLAPADANEISSFQSAAIRFAMKFQQFTSPVMAKSMEDTSFYRYHRLTSLNEVGGDPQRFGITSDVFHRKMQERVSHWPHSMLATSTHDTKRSEDVRARINVLSEIPTVWSRKVRRWRDLNAAKKIEIAGTSAPSLNDEYLLYQTLLGVWPADEAEARQPAFCRRVTEYMVKAVREAKEKTSWANPNAPYEEAVRNFVEAVLTFNESNQFLADFLPFQEDIAKLGALNSLSQTLLKLMCPGVPDIYQGSELWNLSLVDPDSRRAVNYEHRQNVLRDLQLLESKSCSRRTSNIQALTENLADGRIKLYLTLKALSCRKQYPALFQEGEYVPLKVLGGKVDHIIAFARQHAGLTAIVAAPRLWTRLLGDPKASPLNAAMWKDTLVEVPSNCLSRSFHNEFTSDTVPVEESGATGLIKASVLFSGFPVALLTEIPGIGKQG
jgi:(1->4)-alpha-D-glucan 1-alpha-D-glucosylmutase